MPYSYRVVFFDTIDRLRASIQSCFFCLIMDAVVAIACSYYPHDRHGWFSFPLFHALFPSFPPIFFSFSLDTFECVTKQPCLVGKEKEGRGLMQMLLNPLFFQWYHVSTSLVNIWKKKNANNIMPFPLCVLSPLPSQHIKNSHSCKKR